MTQDHKCAPSNRGSRRHSPTAEMKHLAELLLAGYMVFTSGCATNYVVEWKAKPHRKFDKQTEHDVEVAGHPAYYVLLPVTIPLDIVTAPVQLGVLLAWPAARTNPSTNANRSWWFKILQSDDHTSDLTRG